MEETTSERPGGQANGHQQGALNWVTWCALGRYREPPPSRGHANLPHLACDAAGTLWKMIHCGSRSLRKW